MYSRRTIEEVEAIGETAAKEAVAYREDRSSPSARCGSNRKEGEEGKERTAQRGKRLGTLVS